MTKKKKEEVVVEAPQVVEKPKIEKPKVKKPEWELKDRVYFLKGKRQPLTLRIPSRHNKKHAPS